jgi:hypothetical protein
MLPDLGAAAAYSEHQMGARVHGRKIGHPHVLEEAQHRQLSLLIDQGIICENGEVQKQVRTPGWK